MAGHREKERFVGRPTRVGPQRDATVLVDLTAILATRCWPQAKGENAAESKILVYSNVTRAHVYVREVLHGVLYPEAHMKSIPKKKKERFVGMPHVG